ncbi:hypothetical protein EC973_001723 [Apophysomyces ossiformis]|uniref:Uncharacterized protein n=1 Tax=Apophysomyces ossiformis TaxID=679940 RepID=A0A8H7BNN8_9FUNG|nr:hypothetical protein EC973_001723 [Apophysomyces ossiformis]
MATAAPAVTNQGSQDATGSMSSTEHRLDMGQDQRYQYKIFVETIDVLNIPNEHLKEGYVFSRVYNHYYDPKGTALDPMAEGIPCEDGRFRPKVEWLYVFFKDESEGLKSLSLKFTAFASGNLAVFAFVFQVYGIKNAMALFVFTAYVVLVILGFLHYLYIVYKEYTARVASKEELDYIAERYQVSKVTYLTFNTMNLQSAGHFGEVAFGQVVYGAVTVVEMIGVLLLCALQVLTLVYLFLYGPS